MIPPYRCQLLRQKFAVAEPNASGGAPSYARTTTLKNQLLVHALCLALVLDGCRLEFNHLAHDIKRSEGETRALMRELVRLDVDGSARTREQTRDHLALVHHGHLCPFTTVCMLLMSCQSLNALEVCFIQRSNSHSLSAYTNFRAYATCPTSLLTSPPEILRVVRHPTQWLSSKSRWCFRALAKDAPSSGKLAGESSSDALENFGRVK